MIKCNNSKWIKLKKKWSLTRTKKKPRQKKNYEVQFLANLKLKDKIKKKNI
jgi:hypothetical protein